MFFHRLFPKNRKHSFLFEDLFAPLQARHRGSTFSPLKPGAKVELLLQWAATELKVPGEWLEREGN